MNFDLMLHAVRSGEMTIDAFFIETDQIWTNIAKHLMKRWRAPDWFDVEELAQECRIESLAFIKKYDEAKDVHKKGFWYYVRYNAMDKGKKRLHQIRGVNLHREADKQKTVIREVNGFSGDFAMVHTRIKAIVSERHVSDLAQLDSMIAFNAAIAACDTEIERQVIRIMADTESISKATSHVLSNVRGITQRRARFIVARTTIKVRDRVAAKAA